MKGEKLFSRKIYKITVGLYGLATGICALFRWVETKDLLAVAIVLASLLFLLILPVFFKLCRLQPAYLLASVVDVFIFMAFTLGVAMRWYARISWYDLFVHGVSGGIFALLGACIFHLLREDKGRPSYNGSLCAAFSFSFSMMIAGMWEIMEYVMFLLTGYDSQWVADTGVGDTMEDMMICLAGAVVISLLLLLHYKKKKLFLFSPVDEFCRLNPGKEAEK